MAEVLRREARSELLISSSLSVDFVQFEKHQSWVQWIHASINKHFTDRRSTYQLYLEGDERIFQDESEFAELRIDGPFITQPQKGLYYLDVEINVLVQTHVDAKDFYKIHKIIGLFTKGFTNNINVYKLGNETLDNNSLLGCLHLQTDLRENVAINNYGIIQKDTRLTQTTIEGHYRLELCN